MAGKKKQSIGVTILTIIAAIVIIALRQGQNGPGATPNPSSPPPTATGGAGAPAGGSDPGARAVIDAFDNERSDVLVEFEATVSKVLPDDNEGDEHQRFIVTIDGFDHTILVSHNIDLAERVPVRAGDTVRVRGEYEWSDRGGVIHWTHHNPNRNSRHPGGWIDHKGTRYE